MGGVGLSEFEDVVKHTFPQVFVRMVAEIIRPRSMQVNLGPPEDNRQLIIRGEVEIAKEKRNKPARSSKIPNFHSFNFLGDFNNMVPIHPKIVSIQNFKTPIRGGRDMRRRDQLSTTKLTSNFMNSTRNQNGVFDVTKLSNLWANKNSNPPEAPGINTITVKARGVLHKPSWEQRTKFGNDFHRKTVGFLQAQNMPLLC